jgi:tRNA (cmo5U34)-methyltransferase
MPAEKWTSERHAFRYLERADECLVALVVLWTSGLGTVACSPFCKLIARRWFGPALTSPNHAGRSRRKLRRRPRIELVRHDLTDPLPALGSFDAIVSSMAIHHLDHERKRLLYGEVLDPLKPGDVFANFEHVASRTHRQPGWLRALGFVDVDCYWKWLEMALLIAVGSAEPSVGSSIG